MPLDFILIQTAKGEGGLRKACKFCVPTLLGKQHRKRGVSLDRDVPPTLDGREVKANRLRTSVECQDLES